MPQDGFYAGPGIVTKIKKATPQIGHSQPLHGIAFILLYYFVLSIAHPDTLIRFDPLSLLGKHGSRCKYDTFDPGTCKLVVKGIAETACLITAFNRIFIIGTEFHLQRFDEADDFL